MKKWLLLAALISITGAAGWHAVHVMLPNGWLIAGPPPLTSGTGAA